MTISQPKYPGCTVQLVNTSANAVAIFRKVRRELIRHLVDTGTSWAEAEQEGNAFQDEATSGDHDHVLITCQRWVNVT